MKVKAIKKSRKRNPDDGWYPATGYDAIDDALDSSRGQIVFQEDLMWLFSSVCDIEFGQADLVRRITAKKYDMRDPKQAKVILEAKAQWVQGCKDNNIPDDVANEWWEKILANSGYSFNRSHAVAYSIATAQTMWLKYHYPLQYCASYLTTYPKEKSVWIRNLISKGERIIAPNVNTSGALKYSVIDGKLALNLLAIEGIGLKASTAIEETKPYDSLEEFMIKLGAIGALRTVHKTIRTKLWLIGALSGIEGSFEDLETDYHIKVYNQEGEWEVNSYQVLNEFVENGYGVRVYDSKALVAERHIPKFEYPNKMRLQSELLGGNILYDADARQILKPYIDKDYEFGIVTKIVNGKSTTGKSRVEVHIGKNTDADFYYQKSKDAYVTARLGKPLAEGMFIAYRRDKENWGGRYLDNVGSYKKPVFAIYDITDKFE